MILEQFNHVKEYAGGKLISLTLQDTPKEQTAQQWIEEVQTLFDPAMIKKLSKADQPSGLHGRRVILGLSLLELKYRQKIKKISAIAVLI